jgi:hypothetical protein
MMTKWEKLEADMKEIKHSLEFAHAEIADLKKKAIPAIPERDQKNTTEMIHELLRNEDGNPRRAE